VHGIFPFLKKETVLKKPVYLPLTVNDPTNLPREIPIATVHDSSVIAFLNSLLASHALPFTHTRAKENTRISAIAQV
jgi:hypothetical protein